MAQTGRQTADTGLSTGMSSPGRPPGRRAPRQWATLGGGAELLEGGGGGREGIALCCSDPPSGPGDMLSSAKDGEGPSAPRPPSIPGPGFLLQGPACSSDARPERGDAETRASVGCPGWGLGLPVRGHG